MLENILEEVGKAEKIIIYGAHLVALECARWLIKMGKRDNILGFAVTDMEGNPNELLQIPVKQIELYQAENDNLIVIIAMPEKYHSIVENHARQIGFEKFIKLSLECMSKIKAMWLLEEQEKYPQLSFALKESRNDVTWLDIVERNSENKGLCKFPTLFYRDDREVFSLALNDKFYEGYEKVCGQNSNLHLLPVNHEHITEIKNISDVIRIYALFSEWDSAQIKSGKCDEWMYPLQVGSKLAAQRYGDLFDDVGENISEKNRLFAELTGTYWVWKNQNTSKYKGICHYRRHFMVSKEEIMALLSHDIDVLLTTPRYVPGGIKNMFMAETPVKESVYQSMLRAIKEIYPDDKNCFEKYMDSDFYYPNNMVVAANSIFDDYCAWMFPILFRMSEIDKETAYGHETDRHIAYAAELLTSYYFAKNRKKYNIAVTDYQLFN